jgi:hypothetical protein
MAARPKEASHNPRMLTRSDSADTADGSNERQRGADGTALERSGRASRTYRRLRNEQQWQSFFSIGCCEMTRAMKPIE